MNCDEKNLIEKFEQEVWLYLDESLSEERMQFWDKQLEENNYLRNVINNIKYVTNSYNSIQQPILNEERFNSMIDKTIKSKTLFIHRIKQYFIKEERKIYQGKLAFLFTLLIIVFSFIILNNKKNFIKKKIHAKTSIHIEWNANSIDKKISKLNTRIKLVRNEDFRNYYYNRIINNQWKKNTMAIGNKIRKIKFNLENNKF